MRNFRDRHRNPGGPLVARRGGGAPWTPAALSPYAWYDVYLGGSSTQITDSSANGRAAATFGASTAAPSYVAGSRFVTFDGVNDIIDVPAAAMPPMATEAWSAVWVGTVSASYSPWARLFSNRSSGGTTKGFDMAMDNTGTNQLQAFVSEGVSQVGQALSWASGVRSVITFKNNGTSRFFANNGASASVEAQKNVQNTVGRIGSSTGAGGNYFTGTFEALILFDRCITDAEHAQLVAHYGGGL